MAVITAKIGGDKGATGMLTTFGAGKIAVGPERQ